MCMVKIRNRKTLQSKVNICKSDVQIGDYADSLVLKFIFDSCNSQENCVLCDTVGFIYFKIANGEKQ